MAATKEERDAAATYWNSLLDDPNTPLVLRATEGSLTPGLTFKTVTAAAGIDTGTISPSTIYEDNGSINIGGRELIENNRPDDSVDQWTVSEGFAYSLNPSSRRLGSMLAQQR